MLTDEYTVERKKVGGFAMDPESVFLASKEETTGNEWELYKENVRPLKRGRDVKLLNDSLKSNSDPNIRNHLIQTRR